MLAKEKLFTKRNQSLENHWLEECVRNFEISLTASNPFKKEVIVQHSFESLNALNPKTLLNLFLAHILAMESEQLTLYREVFEQRNEYSKFKLEIFPFFFAPEIINAASKSIIG